MLDAPALPAGVTEFLEGQANAEPSLQLVAEQLADGRLTILNLVSQASLIPHTCRPLAKLAADVMHVAPGEGPGRIADKRGGCHPLPRHPSAVRGAWFSFAHVRACGALVKTFPAAACNM